MSISRLIRAGVWGGTRRMITGDMSICALCLPAKAGTSSYFRNTDPVLHASRHLHASHLLHAVDVKVPTMGDSITEGSIASVLRQTGDLVEEDEPILQIETDKVKNRAFSVFSILRLFGATDQPKVTIDVRAPTRGILRALTVKKEDTVTVGAVIAVLDELEGTAPAVAAAPQKAVDLEELTAAASEMSDSTLRGNKARISFPPRRTSEGFVISAMPAVDQQKYIARSSSSAAPAGLGVAAAASQASAAALAEHIARRTLDEKEMEYIMLGGAEP